MNAYRGKRLKPRLTYSGWCFVVIGIPLIAAAWNTGLNLLYIVLGGVASFLLLNPILSRLSLSKLELRREAPRAVHRDDPYYMYVSLFNGKRLFSAASIKLVMEGSATPPGYVLKLPARKHADFNLEQRHSRRGIYPLPEMDAVCSYPFGLVAYRRRYRDNAEMYVYPRVRPVRGAFLDSLGGSHYATRKPTSDGEEFFELREYHPGDDLRHVAWRVSARVGTWMVRELARDNYRSAAIVFDTRMPAMPETDAAAAEEDFEDAVDLVASMAVSLLNRQYAVAVLTPAAQVEMGEGNVHERRILDMLAGVAPLDEGAGKGFDGILSQFEGVAMSVLWVSADRRAWGTLRPGMRTRVVNPREVLYA